MAGKGPTPLPKKTLELRDSWRAKSQPAVTGAFRQGRPRRPRGLRDEARRAWDRVVVELVGAGLLSKADYSMLLTFAELSADVEELRSTLRAEGLTVKAASGAPRAHPAVKLLREAEQALRLVAGELGLSPSGR